MQGPLGMFLVGSTVNQDLETLMALERAHILANYTQVRPRGDPSTCQTLITGMGPEPRMGPFSADKDQSLQKQVRRGGGSRALGSS